MQLSQSARWLMPALLLSAVSPFTYAGALPAMPVALRIFPAMAQPQAGKDAGATAQTPTGENPPAKKHRFTLNVNGIQVGVGATTKKQTTTTAKPATDSPNTSAAPTTAGTPPQQQDASPALAPSVAIISGVAIAVQNKEIPGSGGQTGAPLWDGDIKKPITFRWMPVVPKPKDLAGYRVAVWQLQQGQTGPQAFRANQPIITKDVDSISITQAIDPNFITGTCRRPALCSYVWSVQALDKKGRPVGVNGGIVSMAAFRYEPGTMATRGTPLIVVDGNQPAAPGIFDRWGELYAEAGAAAMNGAHVTATNTATGVRLATSGQQQKPQPQNSNVTARIKGTVTDPQGGAVPVTATANPQSGGDRTYIGNPEPKFENGAPVGSSPQPNDNPISAINITLPWNPDAYTVNWGDGDGTNKFSIEAVGPPTDARGMGRLYGGVEQSRILVIVRKNGNLVCGGQTSFGAVQGGFAPVSKAWRGKDAAALLGNSCSLPQGDYELAVQVVGTQGGTDVALSALAIKPFTIRGNDQQASRSAQANSGPVSGGGPGALTISLQPAPSTLNEDKVRQNPGYSRVIGNSTGATSANAQAYQGPTNVNEGVVADIKKPIIFRFVPVTDRNGPVTYRVSVWEILPGQDPIRAIKANQPILTKLTDEPQLGVTADVITGPCKPPYACDYVWNVQALNREGKPIGGNNGTSEAAYFSYNSRGGNIVQRQPGGGRNESSRKGTFIMGLNLSFDVVAPATGAPADSNGGTAGVQEAAPGFHVPGAKHSQLEYLSTAQPNPGPGIGAVTPAAMKANTPNITKDADHINPNDVETYSDANRQTRGTANGVIIVTTKKGKKGKSTNTTAPVQNPTVQQDPGYLSGTWNVSEGYTGTAVQPGSRTGGQGRIDPHVEEGRSVAVPGSSACPGQTLSAGATCALTTSNPDAINTNGAGRSTVDSRGPGSPHATVTPSQGTPIPIEHDPDGMAAHGNTNGSNGKAAPHETVTPSSSTPIPIEHDPDGIAARGKTNGGAAPQAKPAKKKSKIGIHVVF